MGKDRNIPEITSAGAGASWPFFAGGAFAGGAAALPEGFPVGGGVTGRCTRE